MAVHCVAVVPRAEKYAQLSVHAAPDASKARCNSTRWRHKSSILRPLILSRTPARNHHRKASGTPLGQVDRNVRVNPSASF